MDTRRPATALLIALVLTAGCATRGKVEAKARSFEQRLERAAGSAAELEEDLVQQQQALVTLDARTSELEAAAEGASSLAGLALSRAEEVTEEAQDPMAFEIVYVIDEVRFASGAATLDPPSRSILDQLADRLLAENSGYYLEVQGRASAAVGREGSLGLARDRAEAVRRYLHLAKGLPLHHIGAIALHSGSPLPGQHLPGGSRQLVIVVLR